LTEARFREEQENPGKRMFSGWTQGGGLPPKTYESNFIHNSENSIRDIRAAIAVHDFTTAVL